MIARIGILLALSASVACAQTATASPSPTPPPLSVSTCYPEYLTIFHWLNPSRTEEYSYDLRPLCGIDRFLAVPIPNDAAHHYWYFFFSIMGNVSRSTFSCNPVWQPTYFSGGSFIQVYSYDYPTPSPIPGQTDPETGAPVDNPSPPCIIFAHDRPEFDLIDEANPATGGLRLSYSGMTEPSSDAFNQCPTSPIYGDGEQPRFLRINLLCDPSVADMRTDATLFSEYAPCKYELDVSTKAACGASGDPFSLPATSRGATNFGFTVLGSVLTCVGYASVLFLDARGYLEPIKSRLPSCGRQGRSYIKAPSSGSAALTGATGSSYGSA